MPIKVTCSNCGGVLHAPDDAGGKRGRCPTCGNVLPIPAEAPKLPQSGGDSTKASHRPASFGDFNLGPQVAQPTATARAAPAVGSALPFADDAPASARSSVPSLNEPAVPARRGRGAAATVPPVDDRRRPNDPFARKSSGTPDADDKVARRWKKVRGGLWWVRASIPFFLMPILVLNGLKLYEQLVAPIPVQDPGYLKQAWLTSQQELELVAVIAPFALGVVLILLGRLGVSRVPQVAQTRGLAGFAALATLVVVCSGVAIVFPVVALLALGEKDLPIVVRTNGVAEWRLMLPSDNEGIMQRLGLIVGATAFVLAEVWFAAALGRIGTALNSNRLAGRATRYLVLLGLIFGGLVATGSLTPAYNFNSMPREVSTDTNRLIHEQWDAKAEPLIDKIGNARAAVRPAAFIFGGLFIAMVYWRMIGAGRGAVRDWLEQHDRT